MRVYPTFTSPLRVPCIYWHHVITLSTPRKKGFYKEMNLFQSLCQVGRTRSSLTTMLPFTAKQEPIRASGILKVSVWSPARTHHPPLDCLWIPCWIPCIPTATLTAVSGFLLSGVTNQPVSLLNAFLSSLSEYWEGGASTCWLQRIRGRLIWD